jgi:CPA2 family monovalent cation:H+ antiporter-2
MVVDAVVIAAILVVTDLLRGRVTWRLEELLGLGSSAVRALIAGGALVACIPFGNSIIRCARSLGRQMAGATRADGTASDVTAAPRRAMVVALQLVIVTMFAIPLVALTLPLIPPLYTVPVLAAGFAVFAVSFWRSAENLQEHARAVAQVIVEALAEQARDSHAHRLDHVRELLPAMGELTPLELPPGSAIVGKTLAELNVRGLTGATVIAIVRGGEEPVVIPSGKEVLREGDILALTGSHEAVEAAQALLAEPPPSA